MFDNRLTYSHKFNEATIFKLCILDLLLNMEGRIYSKTVGLLCVYVCVCARACVRGCVLECGCLRPLNYIPFTLTELGTQARTQTVSTFRLSCYPANTKVKYRVNTHGSTVHVCRTLQSNIMNTSACSYN